MVYGFISPIYHLSDVSYYDHHPCIVFRFNLLIKNMCPLQKRIDNEISVKDLISSRVFLRTTFNYPPIWTRGIYDASAFSSLSDDSIKTLLTFLIVKGSVLKYNFVYQISPCISAAATSQKKKKTKFPST